MDKYKNTKSYTNNFIRAVGIISLVSSALAYSLIYLSYGFTFMLLPIAWVLLVIAALLPKIISRKAGAWRAIWFSAGIISIGLVTIAGFMLASRTGNCGVYTYSECNTATSMNLFYGYIFLLALFYICEFYYRNKIHQNEQLNTFKNKDTNQIVAPENVALNNRSKNTIIQQTSNMAKLSLEKPTFTWKNLLGLTATTFLASLITIVPLYSILLFASPKTLGPIYLIIMLLALWSIFAQPFVAILLTKRLLKLDATKMIIITTIIFFVFGGFVFATNIILSVLGYLSILFLSYYIQLKLASSKNS